MPCRSDIGPTFKIFWDTSLICFLLLVSLLVPEKRIRHIPVIKGGEMRGMVSIGDVVRAVVDEHREELDRLNLYIQGGY
jgi:hypothetical protein